MAESTPSSDEAESQQTEAQELALATAQLLLCADSIHRTTDQLEQVSLFLDGVQKHAEQAQELTQGWLQVWSKALETRNKDAPPLLRRKSSKMSEEAPLSPGLAMRGRASNTESKRRRSGIPAPASSRSSARSRLKA
mmetsp:Transcript_10525/g.19395  ORF Transcript_10525/g.19395 Transcript_10525/m.19395 type:complete len:137 (-) Transcript_10525:1611-2021(-)